MKLQDARLPIQARAGVVAIKLDRWEHLPRLLPLALFLVCFAVLLRTLAPTVYAVDSAEFATGAAILGIVHAPGYPLYVLLAHLFTLLPVGDVGFRVNLFSAVCLALTAPTLYSLLHLLINQRWIAVATTLVFIWSYYVWASGTVAEIYAPQLLTLALCGWSLVRTYREFEAQRDVGPPALLTGALLGLAVAIAPTSALFAPGIVLAFLLMRVPWRISVTAGLLAVVIFISTLLYFPLRGSAHPEFNKIGFYDAQGTFHNFDFHTVQGILQAISGQQFRYLFFENGFLPSLDQLASTLSWFWRNYSGIGIILGLAGAAYLLRQRRGLMVGWVALTLPYTYFFLCYGAADRDTMFGPTYLAWAVFVAFGLQRLFRILPDLLRAGALFALPLVALITNFSAADLSNDTSVRLYAEAVLQKLPPNAVVAGYWADITPLQYLQFVEHQRPDVKIYDLFMFKPTYFRSYVNRLNESGRTPVVLINSAIMSLPDTSSTYRVSLVPVLTYLPEEEPPVAGSDSDEVECLVSWLCEIRHMTRLEQIAMLAQLSSGPGVDNPFHFPEGGF
jgi:hypothetical protein